MASPDQAYATAGREPEGMTRAEVLEFLRATGKVESWAAARRARGLRVLKDMPADPTDPAKDEADRLRREQNLSRGEANKRAKTAEQLGHLPETQDALENGEINNDHASAMADARAKADDQAKAALAAAEHDLLEQARDESPPEFRKRLERFIADHQGDDGLADHDRQKARTSLRFWNDHDGMKRISGIFVPDLGAEIEHEVRRKSEEAWRAERAGRDEVPAPQSVITNERRMAEALGEICRRSKGADVRDGKRVVPRAGVTMTYENLMGTDDTPAERPDGSPMPAAMARKMACQAGIVPIVLGGETVPLDWGRARRFAQPQQNEALRLWYDTCTLFGCTASIEWCDAHHIEPFEPHGLTNLDNLTHACDHCHDLVHRPGWGVKKDNHGVVTSWAPDGQTWVHHPRDRRRRRERPAQPQPAAASQYEQSVLV